MADTVVTFKKPSPRIGVDKYTLFPLTEDDRKTGKATYGDAIEIPGTVEIAPTDSGSTEAFDADNGAYDVETILESIGHEITNADIPPEVDAMMRGLNLKNGGVEVGKDINAPYFAVAWRVKKLDGSYRLVRYYKGKYGFASPVGAKTKPSSGASEKQTATATYSAVARDCDDAYYFYKDVEATDTEAMENWFTDPNWVPAEASAE